MKIVQSNTEEGQDTKRKDTFAKIVVHAEVLTE